MLGLLASADFASTSIAIVSGHVRDASEVVQSGEEMLVEVCFLHICHSTYLDILGIYCISWATNPKTSIVKLNCMEARTYDP